MTSFKQLDKVCLFCKLDYIAQKDSTKYCSLQCAQKAYKERERNKNINHSIQEEANRQDDIRFSHIREIDEKEFLSIKEACELYHINRKTIYRHIKCGKLKASKIGSQRIIIKKSALIKLYS